MLEGTPLMAAIGWGSLWMLGWLAAATIPLLLHLLHRRRQQELPWAAMDLLLKAIRQNSRTVRIEQWLLLLLRTLAMSLFALAVARPFLSGANSPNDSMSAPAKLWLIVLDASYSMNYTQQNQTLWSVAQQRARNLVSQADPGDAFLLIQLAEPSTAIIGQPSFDAQRVLESIDRLSCTDGAGDLSSCLEVIVQGLEDAKQAAPALQDVRLHVFTDMGADTWQAVGSGPERRTWQDLASRTAMHVESLAPTAPANVAIMSLEAETGLALAGRPVQFSAQISNFSNQAHQRFPVQFQSDGKTVRTEFIELAPHESQIATAELQPPTTGSWHVSVAIPEDSLNLDNQRHLVLAIQAQLRVVTVEASDSNGATGHARLINLSLAPYASGNEPSVAEPTTALHVETWSPGEFLSADWTDIDAFVLCDVPRLEPSTISRLTSFVEMGGAVLATLGPQTQPPQWNEATSGLSQVFGFELTQPSNLGDWRIDPLQYRSPIAKPFANFLDAGLLTTPIFQYWKIAPLAGITLQTDIGLTTGDPYLVRHPLGQGWTAAMLSAPMSGAESRSGQAWNAIATWPSFVPLMQKTIETIVGRNERLLNVITGQALRGVVPRSAQARAFTVERPDNMQNHFSLPPAVDDRTQAWSYSLTDRVGIYHVDDGGSLHQIFAVNLLPNQSEMQSMPTANLPSVADKQRTDLKSVSPTQSNQTRPSERLSVWLLSAVLLMMAAESILAWSLGRRFA